MATTGILRAADVIFYHPLDNGFVEHTIGEVWSGTASSVAGKVGQAESAVTSSAIGVGALSTIVTGTDFFQNDPLGIAVLSPTSVVATYGSNSVDGFGQTPSGDETAKARAGVVSGTTVTWGPEVTYRASADKGSNVSPRSQEDVRALDSTRVIIGYSRAVPQGGYVRVGIVSGLDITFGAELQFSSAIQNGNIVTTVMDSAHAVVLFREGSITGFATSVVCTISGTDVTFGAESTFSTSTSNTAVLSMATTALSSTTVIAATAEGNFLKVGTRSGSDMTWGPANVPPIGLTLGDRVLLEQMTSTTAIFSTSETLGASVQIVTVSGTDITFGATTSGFLNITNHVFTARLNSTTFVAVWRSSTGARAALGTVSGTDITMAPSTVYIVPATFNQKAAALSGTKFIMTAEDISASTGDAFAVIGSLDASAGLSGTSVSYPSAIGHDRVVMAMWARNLTSGSSTVTVERGYGVTMTATSIELGGTTATWSGTGIADLMSAMNDDSDHLLVLDFENTGGTDWTLKTSVDGIGFTDQGTQTSGTQAVTTTDTDPSVSIAAGAGASQWIDEMVMWCGDKSSFESFETQELANLFDLADTFGETMDQFEENFGAPICWQATAKMPDGSVWRDSGSGPCPPVIRVPKGANDIVVTDDGNRASPRVIEG